MTALQQTFSSDSPQPDLTEARRLLDQGFSLVALHPFQKRPVGDNWNKRSVTTIDPAATGYGLPLAVNGLCSIDPDQVEMARAGVAAWGFDLDKIMAQGVRTGSTRPGSGGRAAFSADEMEMLRWLSFAVFDDKGNSVTVLELRAKSQKLQDVVPGIVYTDKTTGMICTQTYVNGRRFDDAPPVPDDFARFWRLLSTDDDALREHTQRFVEAISAAGFKVGGKRAEYRPPMGGGQSLAFPAPGCRGEFNRRFTVPEIIERHGYAYDSKTQRYSHPGATGAPGIRPIPGKDGLWRSDHAGDPLHGTFDAWAAYVQLDHRGAPETAIQAFQAELQASAPADFEAPLDGATEPPGTPPPDALDLDQARVHDLLATDPPPRQWLVRDRLPLGVVGLLAAAGGTGKSMAVLQMAVSVCTGLPWLELPMENPGSVVIFSGEDDRDEIHRRLHIVAKLYAENVDPFDDDAFAPYQKAIAERLYVFDRVGQENRLTAKAHGEVYRTHLVQQVIEVVGKIEDCRLIVLDPLARFDGGDPNDNADGTRLIECAEEIRKATGATVLLPHHVNKSSLKDPNSGQEAVRGGSGLVDGCRWVGLLAGMRPEQAKDYGIPPEEIGHFVRFTTPKANYASPWPGMWLRRLAGGALVPTELKASRETEKEQKAEDRYAGFLIIAKEILARAIAEDRPMTARRLRDFGGTAGKFRMGETTLRGCIARAIDEGDLLRDEDGFLRPGGP